MQMQLIDSTWAHQSPESPQEIPSIPSPEPEIAPPMNPEREIPVQPDPEVAPAPNMPDISPDSAPPEAPPLSPEQFSLHY